MSTFKLDVYNIIKLTNINNHVHIQVQFIKGSESYNKE